MTIGKNIAHESGASHVTGASVFIDDRPELINEVFVGVVTCKIAKGRLLSVNSDKALAHENCLGVYTSKDLAAKKWGAIVHDQPILVVDEISYYDEACAIIASDDRFKVQEIIKLVELEVQAQEACFAISKARAADDYVYKAPKPFKQGDMEKGFAKAAHCLEGTFICGGQEHFYMESQAALAIPTEDGQMEVHASSQHPSETQRVVAEALGVPFHKVVCIVKRMGGGFGGKESQAAPIAAYAAVIAAKLNRPARLILTKDEDMKITGKRHPFENTYKVGFDEAGKITALRVHLQADAGAYSDLSSSILERAMFHTDGAYFLENCEISGISYRTNNSSNTAYRGFGGPQGNMTMESIIEDIAAFLGRDSYEIRRLNIYEGDKDLTPYGQKLENNMLPELFDGLYKSSDYQKRLQEVQAFNKKKNGKVRGLSMTATKFGIAFTARFLNQGSALVNLHLDATVQASTGATEMGQGLNTKIQQIICHAFGIPPKDVLIMTTSTEKNHNTSPTAASSGSDINGAAALDACNKIKGRLTQLALLLFAGAESDAIKELEIKKGSLDADIVFKDNKVRQISTTKEISLKDLINAAYFNRISLGGYSHYKTPGLGFCKEKVEGKAFNYFTQGVAVSEIEICEYTGELKILRSDIFMDLGRPLNPGIDKGQVTGAFVQGAGWVTNEKLIYAKDGELKTYSPTTYKIPNVQDTPRIFNIDFITNDDNECNVHRSKAVGEPPFLLGTSVWTAAKNALSYRSRSKKSELKSPATGEEILTELKRLKSGK